MKYLKIFEQFVSDNRQYKLYYGVSKNTYSYLIVVNVVDNDKVIGMATQGFESEDMENNNVSAIGTIYGPGLGKFLYNGFISRNGKICPSSNESDLAKQSWMKKFKDPSYIKTKIKGVGFYDRYEEEDYLNYIYDIKDKIEVQDLEYNGNEKIFSQAEKMHTDAINSLKDTRHLYTIGQSRDRDEYLKEDGIDPKTAPYENN